MIYAYAVVDDPDVEVGDLRGHGDAPVLSVACSPRMAVVAAVLTTLPAEAGPEALWTHHRVLDGLMGRCAVAPIRFMTVLPGPDELRQLVREREAALTAALELTRGRVELALRASWRRRAAETPGAGPARPEDDDAGAADGPGRRHLRELRQRSRADGDLPALVAGIHRSLAGMAAASVGPRAAQGAVTASYLVDRDQTAPASTLVAATAPALPAVALSLTGPWAPFSFVDGVDGQGTDA